MRASETSDTKDNSEISPLKVYLTPEDYFKIPPVLTRTQMEPSEHTPQHVVPQELGPEDYYYDSPPRVSSELPDQVIDQETINGNQQQDEDWDSQNTDEDVFDAGFDADNAQIETRYRTKNEIEDIRQFHHLDSGQGSKVQHQNGRWEEPEDEDQVSEDEDQGSKVQHQNGRWEEPEDEDQVSEDEDQGSKFQHQNGRWEEPEDEDQVSEVQHQDDRWEEPEDEDQVSEVQHQDDRWEEPEDEDQVSEVQHQDDRWEEPEDKDQVSKDEDQVSKDKDQDSKDEDQDSQKQGENPEPADTLVTRDPTYEALNPQEMQNVYVPLTEQYMLLDPKRSWYYNKVLVWVGPWSTNDELQERGARHESTKDLGPYIWTPEFFTSVRDQAATEVFVRDKPSRLCWYRRVMADIDKQKVVPDRAKIFVLEERQGYPKAIKNKIKKILDARSAGKKGADTRAQNKALEALGLSPIKSNKKPKIKKEDRFSKKDEGKGKNRILGEEPASAKPRKKTTAEDWANMLNKTILKQEGNDEDEPHMLTQLASEYLAKQKEQNSSRSALPAISQDPKGNTRKPPRRDRDLKEDPKKLHQNLKENPKKLHQNLKENPKKLPQVSKAQKAQKINESSAKQATIDLTSPSPTLPPASTSSPAPNTSTSHRAEASTSNLQQKDRDLITRELQGTIMDPAQKASNADPRRRTSNPHLLQSHSSQPQQTPDKAQVVTEKQGRAQSMPSVPKDMGPTGLDLCAALRDLTSAIQNNGVQASQVMVNVDITDQTSQYCLEILRLANSMMQDLSPENQNKYQEKLQFFNAELGKAVATGSKRLGDTLEGPQPKRVQQDHQQDKNPQEQTMISVLQRGKQSSQDSSQRSRVPQEVVVPSSMPAQQSSQDSSQRSMAPQEVMAPSSIPAQQSSQDSSQRSMAPQEVMVPSSMPAQQSSQDSSQRSRVPQEVMVPSSMPAQQSSQDSSQRSMVPQEVMVPSSMPAQQSYQESSQRSMVPQEVMVPLSMPAQQNSPHSQVLLQDQEHRALVPAINYYHQNQAGPYSPMNEHLRNYSPYQVGYSGNHHSMNSPGWNSSLYQGGHVGSQPMNSQVWNPTLYQGPYLNNPAMNPSPYHGPYMGIQGGNPGAITGQGIQPGIGQGNQSGGTGQGIQPGIGQGNQSGSTGHGTNGS